MRTVRLIGLVILLTPLLAACTGPVSVPPTPDVNAIVAQTLQALTAGPGTTPLASTPTPGLLPDIFHKMNEALWSPDASFVIVAIAQNAQMYQGGRAEIIYADGRPRVVLVPFARDMRWGP